MNYQVDYRLEFSIFSYLKQLFYDLQSGLFPKGIKLKTNLRHHLQSDRLIVLTLLTCFEMLTGWARGFVFVER